MKQISTVFFILRLTVRYALFVCLLCACVTPVFAQAPGKINCKITFDNVVDSCRTTNIYGFNDVYYQFHLDKEKLEYELLDTFQNPDSSELNKCAAAYYLGELHAEQAANSLGPKITLQVKIQPGPYFGSPLFVRPVAAALVELGIASISPMIVNLEDSDDPDTRSSSLQVLLKVEGDSDVVKLRLQKALAVQKDPQKQARLQAALKAFT